MTTTIQEELQSFMECTEKMEHALNQLRQAVKEKGASSIQHYINQEEYEKANEVIAELNQFTNMHFISNAEEIVTFAERVMNHQSMPFLPLEKKEVATISVVKTTALTPEETQVLRIVGQTGIARLGDEEATIDEKLLHQLTEKNYLRKEHIGLGDLLYDVFALTEKGVKAYQSVYDVEPIPSQLEQLENEFGSIETGLFLQDIARLFKQRNYQVNELGIHQIEVSKDKRFTHITPDLGHFSREAYKKILDKKNQLKNIGFISIDEKTMQEAMIATKEWAKENPKKCKFLTVHFTTIEKMEHAPKIFESIRF